MQDIFPRDYTFKMCAREPECPNKYINDNILKFVASSAARSETGGCFVTGRYFIILRNTLGEIDHPQPITQVYTDNTASSIIVNDTINQH